MTWLQRRSDARNSLAAGQKQPDARRWGNDVQGAGPGYYSNLKWSNKRGERRVDSDQCPNQYYILLSLFRFPKLQADEGVLWLDAKHDAWDQPASALECHHQTVNIHLSIGAKTTATDPTRRLVLVDLICSIYQMGQRLCILWHDLRAHSLYPQSSLSDRIDSAYSSC